MRIVALTGTVDKRMLVYPIARAISIESNVCIVSDNGAYRRLFSERGNEGMLGRVKIVVDIYEDSMLPRLDEVGIGFDYLLVDSSFEVPTNSDYVIYCRGVNRSLYYDEELKKMGDKPNIEVIISPEPPEEKGVLAVMVDEFICSYIMKIEENKQLMRITNKRYNKLLTKIFSQALGMQESSLFELLSRKDGIASRK